MKKNKNILLYFIGIFIFYEIILFLCPIAGDDWGNYLVGQSGISTIIGNTIKLYKTWEGRIISRFLINILTYHKILWNIINGLFITMIPYFISKIIKPKHKLITYTLILLIPLSMNIYTFSQTIVWIAGNITYLLVIPILLSYIYLLFENKTNKYKYILIILNIITPMFIEHMAIILVIINIYFIIKDYLKNKKINKELLVYLIISIISSLTMILSPGNRYRSLTEDEEFAKMFILVKMIKNIPNFINYTYIVNSSLLILFIMSNCILIKKYIKNKIVKIVLNIYNIFPILTIISYIFQLINKNIFQLFSNSNNIFISTYYITYTIITFYLYIRYTQDDKSDKVIFFFIIGLLSNIIMMVSPTWGYRTSLSTYIFLTIPNILIIDKLYVPLKNKIDFKLLALASTIIIFCYLSFYLSVNMQYNENKKIIKEAIKNKSEIIEIKEYPSFANSNINPTNEYHIVTFKKYYKIKKKQVIKIIPNNWKYYIFYNK